MQIPYLARHFRVLTMDGLGNGRSDRCRDPRRYSAPEFALDCLEVMDATGTDRAVMTCLSRGATYLLALGQMAPERVAGAAFIGPLFPYTLSHYSLLLRDDPVARAVQPHIPLPLVGTGEPAQVGGPVPGLRRVVHLEVLLRAALHKGIEDGIGWGLETDHDTLGATMRGPDAATPRRELRKLAEGLDCPVLVLSGDRDKITPHRDARALARFAGGELEVVPGAGHFPHARKPVQVNLALRDFAEDSLGRERTPRDPTVYRPDGRPRALYISSPIGLGHAQRDVAIARELRRLEPDLQVDWLAQDPVTRVLEGEGESIHPASAHLANESRHIESESAEHDLHCFQALRRMDEILAANFMLFHDVVRDERYDLWIGDEAWELDYYLHENPREKRVPFAWLTDFVGFLPMEDGGEHESFLTADYNADMVDHIADHPEVRDTALFVGNPDDIVPERLGPQLPMIRDWTEKHFDFTGYVTGFDPAELGDRGKLRDELGYGGRRARVHRDRGRVGRRRRPAAAGDRGVPGRKGAGARPADDRGRGSAHRSRVAALASRAWRSCPTCTTSTATWPPATWRSSRAG